jgi:multidrug efflux pump subunit AcrA (membrane-fusion protein)
MKRWILIAGVGIAIVAIGGAMYLGYRDNQAEALATVEAPPTIAVARGEVIYSVTGPGHAVDEGETALQAGVSAPVVTLAALPGEAVRQGQVLVTLGDRAHFAAAAAQARVRVVQARNELEKQQSGLPLAQARVALAQAREACDKAKTARQSKDYARADGETIAVAHAHYIVAQGAVQDAEARYEQVKDLPESDPAHAELLSQLAAAKQNRDRELANYNWLIALPSPQEIAAADAALALAKAQLDQAQSAVDQILGGSGADLALAAAALDEAEAQAAAADADLAGLKVKAPFDGVVTQVKVKAGESVSAGSLLVVLTNPKALAAEVTVVEEDLPLLQSGQAVKLFFDALPQETVGGVIARVVPQRAEGDQAVYPVVIAIPQVPAALVVGMTVDAQIIIQQKTGVLRLPKTAVRPAGGGRGEVQVWNGRTVEKRTIQVGLRGDSYLEVVSGLNEGDLVVAK